MKNTFVLLTLLSIFNYTAAQNDNIGIFKSHTDIGNPKNDNREHPFILAWVGA